MAKFKFTPPVGPHECYFRCGRFLPSMYVEEANYWLWFTGYADRTIHFCPKCQRLMAYEINCLKALTDKKPEGYPKIMVKIPDATAASPCASEKVAGR